MGSNTFECITHRNTFKLSNTNTLEAKVFKIQILLYINIYFKSTHVNCINMYLFIMRGQLVQYIYIYIYVSLKINKAQINPHYNLVISQHYT